MKTAAEYLSRAYSITGPVDRDTNINQARLYAEVDRNDLLERIALTLEELLAIAKSETDK